MEEETNYVIEYQYSFGKGYVTKDLQAHTDSDNYKDEYHFTYRQAKKILKKVIELEKMGNWTRGGKFWLKVL